MMPFVYWMSDGGGAGVGTVLSVLMRWVREQGTPSLIVNGGDIYDDGAPEEFDEFLQQLGGNTRLVCETPGNHDWKTRETMPATGRIPIGYERFWTRFPPPHSMQPIATDRKAGARYEHCIDLDGWRFIFLDTGPCKEEPWPMRDNGRIAWLRDALQAVPGRAKIVMAHHSRLSRGLHGDNEAVDVLWRTLFDASSGQPRAALTLAGHDHNLSVYGPRPMENPKGGSVPFAKGIHVYVNGAGGAGHYAGFKGTEPDLAFDDDNYCVTRINLIDARSIDVDTLNFGKKPTPTTQPTVVDKSLLRIRV